MKMLQQRKLPEIQLCTMFKARKTLTIMKSIKLSYSLLRWYTPIYLIKSLSAKPDISTLVFDKNFGCISCLQGIGLISKYDWVNRISKGLTWQSSFQDLFVVSDKTKLLRSNLELSKFTYTLIHQYTVLEEIRADPIVKRYVCTSNLLYKIK